MNRKLTHYFFMAVLTGAVTLGGLTACSSKDSVAEDLPGGVTTVPAGIPATLIGYEATQEDTGWTRALRPGTNSETGKNTVDSYWSGDETIGVYQSLGSGCVKIGTATAAASETSETTITVTLTQAPDPDYCIYFFLHDVFNDYTGQVGLLTGTNGNSINEKYDYGEAEIKYDSYTVSGNDIITDEKIIFYAGQSVVKFTLVDNGNNDAAINATKLNIHCNGKYGLLQTTNCLTYESTSGDLTITPDGTTNEIYTSMYVYSADDMTLTANDGNGIYTYTTSTSPNFLMGHYYDVTVNMNKILAKITHDNFIDIIFDGGFKSITADDAAALAKQCWTVAGGKVYVVSGITGTDEDLTVNYVMTEDGETTTTISATAILPTIPFEDGSTGWFVEAEDPALQSETIALYGASGDQGTSYTYYGTNFYVSGPIDVTDSAGNIYVGQWGDMVIASQGKTIVKVVFSYGWKNAVGDLRFSSGTFDENATVDNVNATRLTVSSSNTAGTMFDGVTIFYPAE